MCFAKFRYNYGQFRKVAFCEISVQLRTVSECSISRNFGKFRTRRKSYFFFLNFRFYNYSSHFKSIINENQQNYTSLEGLIKLLKTLAESTVKFVKFVDQNCRKRPKFCKIICFRNYAKCRETFDRN